jgi:hypothetical protein
VARYKVAGGLAGLPHLLNFSPNTEGAATGEVREYRFFDPNEEPPAWLVHGFIAGCCVRARQELHVTQMRPLSVTLVIGAGEPARRSKLAEEVNASRMKSLGIRVVVADRDRDIATVGSPSSPA